jgi:hypothetical protein
VQEYVVVDSGGQQLQLRLLLNVSTHCSQPGHVAAFGEPWHCRVVHIDACFAVVVLLIGVCCFGGLWSWVSLSSSSTLSSSSSSSPPLSPLLLVASRL